MRFEVIPAVDVLGGRCVRLLRGQFANATVYSDDPGAMADAFVAQGARRVHIVDLDSARGAADDATTLAVRAAVGRVAGTGCAAQVGGGVRSVEDARRWIAAGAAYVVLGSVALREPEIAACICATFPGQVMLALDVRDGDARADGWVTAAGPAAAHLERWRHWPSAGLIYTDTQRDGTLQGPDLEGITRCSAAYAGPVFASGGVSSLADVEACVVAGAAGAIIGRAIYEGRVDVRHLIDRVTASS